MLVTLRLLRKFLPLVNSAITRLLILNGPQCGRPRSLATWVLRASRPRAVLLRLELNRAKLVSLRHEVRLRWRPLVIRPTVPARVLLLMWDMETFMLIVGCRFRKKSLDRRQTRLLATETMPAGTQVEMLLLRALTTGSVATELQLPPPDTPMVCLSR